MRWKQRTRRPPDNVQQFRGSRPRIKVGRRKSPSPSSPVFLVVMGLAVGAGLGFAAHDLKDSATAWLSSAPAEGQRLVNGTVSRFRDAPPPQESAAEAEATALCIADVHDGDTIRTCEGERIRLENIDAPELPGSPKCTKPGRNGWCDYDLAESSRDELASFLGSGAVTVSRSGTDRYGRTLARLNVDGADAGDHLISMGLAKAWQRRRPAHHAGQQSGSHGRPAGGQYGEVRSVCHAEESYAVHAEKWALQMFNGPRGSLPVHVRAFAQGSDVRST